MRKTHGFTLIELLVILAILAILLVIAIPSYQSVTVQDRMAAEINAFSGDLQFARSSAITQGLPVTVCPSPAPDASTPACSTTGQWSTGWIVFSNPSQSSNYQAGGGQALLRVHQGFAGGDQLVGPSGVDSITFNRMGGTSGFGTFVLKNQPVNASFTRCLLVSMGGTNQVLSAQSNPGSCS
jgi:type IV fimbrial biogenesis protein FimT